MIFLAQIFIEDLKWNQIIVVECFNDFPMTINIQQEIFSVLRPSTLFFLEYVR